VILQGVLPTAKWAEMAITDAQADGMGLSGNPNQRFRALKAYARRYYEAVAIPEAELRAAALSAGLLGVK
jgi:hypothetical protein